MSDSAFKNHLRQLILNLITFLIVENRPFYLIGRRSTIRMIALLIATVLAFGTLSAQQQKIKISPITLDENDNTALARKKLDANGNAMAVIIVEPATDSGEYSFDMGGTPFEKETAKVNGKTIYLLWVSPGVRFVDISYDSPNVDGDRCNFGRTKIESSKTYRIKLGELFLTDAKQYLEFTIDPKSGDTYLEVAGEPWKLDSNGHASKSVRFGEYEYRATAPGYHDEVGRVTVNDPKQAVPVRLILRPAFGYLTIPATEELKGAEIYVDNRHIGTGSVNKYKLDSKQGYTLKIAKNLYNPYEASFDINDGQTTTLTPVLSGNFARARISAPKNAGIYVDGKLMAQGEWNGPLEEGNHVIEARLEGHTPSRKPVNVTDIKKPVVIDMPAPSPIFGSLELTSTPSGATIKVDGTVRGKTPLVISDLIIGNHKVELTHPDYQPWTQSVTLKQGEPVAVNARMTNIITVRINAPQDNYIYVNGMRKEVKNGYYELRGKPGEYTITAPGGYFYKDYTKTTTFDAEHRSITIKHKRRLHQRNDYYFSAGIGGGNLFDAEFTTGFHLGGFNFEMFYNLPFANHIAKLTAYRPVEGSSSVDGQPTYWEPVGDSYSEAKATMIIGARAGWRILTPSAFDITPMIGYRHVLMKSNLGASYEDEWYNSYCASGLAALRLYWACGYNFGLSLTPEYYFAIAKGDAYSQFSEYSSKIKGWGTGFRVNLSAVIIF